MKRTSLHRNTRIWNDIKGRSSCNLEVAREGDGQMRPRKGVMGLKMEPLAEVPVRTTKRIRVAEGISRRGRCGRLQEQKKGGSAIAECYHCTEGTSQVIFGTADLQKNRRQRAKEIWRDIHEKTTVGGTVTELSERQRKEFGKKRSKT